MLSRLVCAVRVVCLSRKKGILPSNSTQPRPAIMPKRGASKNPGNGAYQHEACSQIATTDVFVCVCDWLAEVLLAIERAGNIAYKKGDSQRERLKPMYLEQNVAKKWRTCFSHLGEAQGSWCGLF